MKKSASMPAWNPNGVYVVALYSYKSGGKDKLELCKVCLQKLLSFFCGDCRTFVLL